MKKCAAFWNHTNLRSGNRIYPCCRFKESVQSFNGNVGNILFSDEYDKLRNTDVSKLPGCAKCMYEESNGKESLREKFNKQYNTEEIKLQYFEVGFDNICNLSCDGCWSEWSHTWALKEDPSKTIKQVIVSTDELYNIPDTINKVLFLGGEPLMTNRHRKFLQNLKSLDYLEVVYNTNGMHLLLQDDIDLLLKCKHVEIIVSIDGYSKLNEKVRSGSDWQQIQNLIKQVKGIFDLTIHTTIHKNNWHGLRDLYNWIIQNNFNWTTNVLTYPTKLDIINLTESEKHQLKEILDTVDIPNSGYIKEHLDGH